MPIKDLIRRFVSSLTSSAESASKDAESVSPPNTAPNEAQLHTTTPQSAGEAVPGSRVHIISSYSTDIFGQPDEEHAFQRGHIDGAFEGDQESFLAFIKHRIALRQLEDQLEIVKRERDETREQLADVKQTQLQLAEAEAHAEVQERRVGEAKVAYQASEKELADARREEERTRGRGSMLHAIPYLLAGLAFFLGDLIVSYEVVAQALQLGSSNNETVVFIERLMFAFGIASLTFLLKPAYERLCEEAYWKGRDRIFRWVILISATLALLTLGLLGGLRAEFVQALQAASNTSTQFEISLDPTVPTIDGLDSGTSSEDTSQLQILAFILTSLLFAIAGAVCLGIATLYWRTYFDERRPAIRRLRGARRWYTPALPVQTQRLKEAWQEAERELANQQALIKSLRNRIEELGPADKLRQRIAELDLHLTTLSEAHKEQHREALIASYHSGYVLASRNLNPGGLPSGDGFSVNPNGFALGRHQVDPHSIKGLQSESRAGGQNSNQKSHVKKPRPFLWVRRDIMKHARTYNDPDR